MPSPTLVPQAVTVASVADMGRPGAVADRFGEGVFQALVGVQGGEGAGRVGRGGGVGLGREDGAA
jgi:hypothetical protein